MKLTITCLGISLYFYLILQACRHKFEKCGENEGGCTDDSQCKPGLICGINNCGRNSLGTDCCTKGNCCDSYINTAQKAAFNITDG